MLLDLKALKATLEQLEEEKRIPKEKIIDAIEQSLAAAYKKDYGKRGQIIKCQFNTETGDMEFYQVKKVVDDTLVRPALTEEELEMVKEGTFVDEKAEDDERPRFDEEKHMLLPDAKKIKGSVAIGDELVFPLETEENFGRIAAQTAKQVIIQRIREAEKESVMGEYADKIGTILAGTVQKVERGTVIVDFNRAIGFLQKNEQIPGEFYRTGDRIKVFLFGVDDSPRGVGLKISRSHPKFIQALFAMESPEVASGVVEIKSIAREAGARSKIAVWSNDPDIDPIGACVGQKGIRVTTVMGEMSGEKIDIIPFSENATEFVAAALAPAKVLDIKLDESDEGKKAEVTVAEDQLSLAIGKGGQNARLAAKLTGWKIDIKGIQGETATPSEAEEVTENEEGYTSLKDLKNIVTEEASAETTTSDEE